MRLGLIASVIVASLALASGASAAGWSSVTLPPRNGPEGIACTSTRWCMGVGGWDEKLTSAHWNGRLWSVAPAPPLPRGAQSGSLYAVKCRSNRSCVAVGVWAKRGIAPVEPLVERWNGSHWTAQSVPSAPAPSGYRHTNTRLYGIACPGAKLCFAVGQAVAFGAGNTPGVPLIERWNGARWSLEGSPSATGPLRSISCASARACTAVGGAGLVERWNGSAWSPESFPAQAQLLGVSCDGTRYCLAVGTAGPSLVANWDGASWTTQTLPAPARATLAATYCSATCVAVGSWRAPNGDTGPLAANWDGETWSTTVLHRGPTELTSVSCPALGWCMAVGFGIAERFIG